MAEWLDIEAMKNDRRFLPFEGKWPRVHASAFIAETAILIGDVEIGEGASVWYHCVLRGDTNYIRVGARSNIQDGTILHVNRQQFPCILGEDVAIGHAAIVHACTLENRAFVGMGATVLDGAVIEQGGMIGANGLLPPGKRIGRNELWTGAPAKLARVMSDEDRKRFDMVADHYVELGQRHRVGAVR